MSVIGCHLHHMLLIWRSFRNSNKTFVPNLFYAGSFVNRSNSLQSVLDNYVCWIQKIKQWQNYKSSRKSGPAYPIPL